MKTYRGFRDADGNCHVHVVSENRKRALRWRLDLFNHSPCGFEWGYGGSGPAQLALAILADALGDDERAVQLHQSFKWKMITTLPRDAPWEFTITQVLAIADALSRPQPQGSAWAPLALLAALATALLLASTDAASAIECRTSPGASTSGTWWSWREIDGRKCWYAGKPGIDKSLLHWEMTDHGQLVRPRSDGQGPAAMVPDSALADDNDDASPEAAASPAPPPAALPAAVADDEPQAAQPIIPSPPTAVAPQPEPLPQPHAAVMPRPSAWLRDLVIVTLLTFGGICCLGLAQVVRYR